MLTKRLLLIPCLILLLSTVAVRDTLDDWGEVVEMRTASPIDLAVGYWHNWTGRWAYALVAGIVHKAQPGLAALLALTAVLGAGWLIGRWLGLAVVLVGLASLPNLGQSVYWTSGTLVYGLPCGLLGLVIYGIFRADLRTGGI